jgi:ricin-type beta-trefoil lectin protein
VDVPSASTTSGTQLWQYTCGGGGNQTWTFTPSSAASGKYLIKSVGTGLCVSDKDGSTAGTNPIVEETCSDIARMQWSVKTTSAAPSGPVVAFPGAVGFGAVATGGRGGSVAKSGALPRDQVDNLVLSDVRSLGTSGNLWSHQTSTGLGNSGYGTIAGGTASVDSDRDGMPDSWKLKYGLNPDNAADATGDFDHTGYTNVEKYINGLLDGSYR